MPIQDGGVSGREFIMANAAQSAGAIPGPWRPSVMYGAATTPYFDDFDTITGGRGLIRLDNPFGSTDYLSATSEAEFITRLTAYLNQAPVLDAIERGSSALVWRCPDYLASGTALYSGTFVPTDNTAGGAWQDASELLGDTCQTVLGSLYRAPRNAAGAIEIGQPGLIFELGNEWGGGTGTQLSNSQTTYKRFWDGVMTSDPDAAVTLPGPVNYTVTEGTGNSYLEEMIAFAGANACPPGLINWHNFQGATGYALVPGHRVAEGAAEVTAALAAAGLPANTPRIHTEFQCNLISADGTGARNDHRAAAYLASTLWEHWQAGVSGMAMATLIKQGDTPPDSNPFAEAGSFAGWGMITKGTVRVPVPSFSLMKLFALWDGGLSLGGAARPPSGVRHFSATVGNDVIVLASRWNPGGATRPLDIAALHPGKTLTEARVYRFDATNNNPVATFANAVGTDIQKADAARALALAPAFTTTTANPISLQFASVDTALVRFMFA